MSKQEILKRLNVLNDAIALVERTREKVADTEEDAQRLETAFTTLENAVKAILEIPPSDAGSFGREISDKLENAIKAIREIPEQS